MEKEQIFYIIFLLIWITGLAGVIISPIIRLIYSGLINVSPNIVFKQLPTLLV